MNIIASILLILFGIFGIIVVSGSCILVGVLFYRIITKTIKGEKIFSDDDI